MADTTLVTVDDLKSWAAPSMDGARDDELMRCLNRAVSWIEKRTQRKLESASYTEYIDGLSGIDRIWIHPGRRPVIYTPLASPAVTITVTEDGVSLNLTEGYSTTADVIVVGANSDTPCALVRNNATWSSGTQNIKVVYTAGWTSTTIPAAYVALILEIAQLIFLSPAWLGRASASTAGHSLSFEKDLSPIARDTLHSMVVD